MGSVLELFGKQDRGDDLPELIGCLPLVVEDEGGLRFDLKYYYLDEFTVTRGENNPLDLAGMLGGPEHTVYASGIWNTGDWSFYTQVRWLSSVVFDNTDDEFSRDLRGVDAWYVFNSSVTWQFSDSMSLQLNIDNLFDKEAPPLHESYHPGIVGRMARLTYRANFQ